MREYVSQGIVLRVEPRREADGRITVFTRRFGKLAARSISSRKITSKLAGHLQPGNLVAGRFVERQGLRVVDAVKVRAVSILPRDLVALERLLPEFEPDEDIWQALRQGKLSWSAILAHLGWDPRQARCAVCGDPVVAFDMRSQEFFCIVCASKARSDEVLYL